MTVTKTLIAAKAMHNRFEGKAERADPFYTRVHWDDLPDESRDEFIEYATVMIDAIEQANIVIPGPGGAND